MDRQRTIAEKVSCTGLGLHTGASVHLTLRPARINTGIVFVRRDGARAIEIPANARFVSSTSHATTLSHGGASVATVEHLLAALRALGIDNARVDVDGPEIPAMDGSSAAFVRMIREAGFYEQSEVRPQLRIVAPVEVIDGDRRIRVEPESHLRISYSVDFDHPVIRRQTLHLDRMDADVFVGELASARTFGFLHEVSALRSAGLAQGGSLQNTVVLGASRVVNRDGLRWADEFVRHKTLDMIGDLSLLGPWLCGHVKVERGGHALHHALVGAILARPDAWMVTGADDCRASESESSALVAGA